MLNKTSHNEKDKYQVISIICGLSKSKESIDKDKLKQTFGLGTEIDYQRGSGVLKRREAIQ